VEGFKFGVAGLRGGADLDLLVTCCDSDLDKNLNRPCLAISNSAQKQAQKMKMTKFTVTTYLRECTTAPEIRLPLIPLGQYL